MKKMKPVTVLCLLCLVPLCLGLNLQEDDLVFDDIGEETPSLSTESEPQQQTRDTVTANVRTSENVSTKPPKKWQRIEKLLDMPDVVASVGHVFNIHVPKHSVNGNYFEAKGCSGRDLSHWLHWDEPASALYGVPSRKDVGRHRVCVGAYNKFGKIAQDSFIVHVVPEKREHFKHKDGNKRCGEEQDRTMLTILTDARYESLKPRAKVNALENLAGFFGLATSSISIQPEVYRDGPSSAGSSVVLSGPGNVERRREKHSTLVQWQVGCDGHFWPRQIDTIKQIPEQARDGTLSEVLQLPVYQWRVRSEPPDNARSRREAAGSGDDILPDEEDDEYDEDDYDGEDYDSNEGVTVPPHEPKQKPIVHQPGITDEHPHRHHHGEDNIAGINNEEDFIWRNEEINNAIFNSTIATTPTTTTTTTTTLASTLPSSTTTTTTTTPSTTTTTDATITTTTSTVSTTPTTTTMTTTTTTEASVSGTYSVESTNETWSFINSSLSSTTTPEETSSSNFESVTLSTTGQSAVIYENATTKMTTASHEFVNLTQLTVSGSFVNPNATANNSLDSEESLTTERDTEEETEVDATTTLQSNVFGASEDSTSGTPGFGEPNVTSIFSVNATADEYTEPSPRESSPSSTSSSFVTTSWNDTAEKTFDERDPYESMNVPVYSSSSSTTTSTTPETTPETTITTTPSTSTTERTTTTMSTTSVTTTTTTTEPTTTPSTTTVSTTTTTTTTEAPRTTTPQTTTSTMTHNYPPEVERRLKKIPITQGKLLSYTIPEDTFHDLEDGNTRQLRLRIYEKHAPLKPTYWLQFNEQTQEVYGLPLEEQYGSYPFEVIATDREGQSVSDKLDIFVQQHKQIRAVNHEFHIYLKIEKRSEFPTNVDWQLKVMRSLAELYGDSDLSYITVRSIDISDDQAIYTWTNDSLVRSNTCPQDEINRLYRVLINDEKSEEPSESLIRALGPEIRPKRVVYQGLEQCQQIKETQVNKYPVPRNQIDQLNATVGQLFVFRVPKDTFFDEEDGDTESMKASLLTANRTEIPPWEWLQFDSSNQEFYGVPLKQDIGRKTYQLVVKDREGLEATDSLVAEVHPAPLSRHVVEISMTLNMPYKMFIHSAQKKREFIQKLQKLYGDRNASAISLYTITGNSETTTVTWRNLTLPTYECPHEEIARLRRVLVNDNKSFTDELNLEFNSNNQQPEFAVIQITVLQKGACQEIGIGGPEIPPIDDSTSVGASHDDYLITFVLPAIIIAAMLILAGIIACILYKRRRSGKMSVSEKDDERQSFRSKGIPVIFQDELDEKPDPGNKSPIILKEEKPPLPPPEYQRAEDGADIPMLSKENSEEPYQPPPPFATNRDNNRQNRPKPTPTYRKPPPYVPP